jgi:amino acid adenylation domain-containing protein
MQLENVEDVLPLSPTQAGMLYHSVSAPRSGVYVEQISCLIDGSLDVGEFKAAWQDVLARHTALRMAFLWDGLDAPLQVVRQHAAPAWKVEDWSGYSETLKKVALDAWLAEDRRTGLDLTQAPLMHMLLIRLGDRRHRFVWTCHHLLADGWSTAIVLHEVFHCYAARRSGEPCTLPQPRQYRDYIAWLKTQQATESAPFWAGYLRDFTARTSLRTPRVAGTCNQAPFHRTLESHLDDSLTSSLNAAARSLRVTLNTLMLGAWALLLQRYSGEDDVVFGTTVAGRPAELPNIESCIGLFINTLPLRVQLQQQQLLGEWLAALQQNLLRLRQHEHTPLAKIQEWSDMAAAEALFETLLVFENYPPRDQEEAQRPEVRVGDLEYREQSNYPLAILVVPGDRLRLLLVFDPARYDEVNAARVLAHFQNLLAALPSHLDRQLGEVSMLAAAERRQLLLEWNDTAARLADGITLLDLVGSHVTSDPGSIALVCGEERLTYAELWNRADLLAVRLQQAGVGPGTVVAIHLERGTALVTAIMAILKAGGCYLPLDPDYPPERLAYMVRDSGAQVLVCSGKMSRPELAARPMTEIFIEEITATPPQRHAIPPVLPAVDDQQPAYLIYTSGSSGEPKGVMITHRNLLSSTLARRTYYQQDPGVFLLLSSAAFDSSVAGIFWTLSSGGVLVLAEQHLEQDIQQLARSILRHGVTHTLCLPSLYAAILGYADSAMLQTLRTVILAGEPLPPSLLQQHRQRTTDTALHNEYGPTEATVWCCAYDTDAHDVNVPIPIGRPVANTRIYILDRHAHPVAVGTPGEIHIAGEGVAGGYLNKPDATAQKFISLKLGGRVERLYKSGDLGRYREDGNIEFLGRVDRQIKLRGYRIEPAEIEAALLMHAAVAEAVVLLATPAGQQGAIPAASRLAAFVTAAGPALGKPAVETTDALRRHLRGHLPVYMIPADFHLLEEMPLLPNGKVDVRALLDLRLERPDAFAAAVAPRNDRERLLAAIWREVLQLESVGVHDNFFELGGDSILSIHAASKINQQGFALSPNDLFNFPTIAQLDARIGSTEVVERQPPEPPPGDATAALEMHAAAGESAEPAAARLPFIMVHAGKMMVSALRSHLSIDRPVYVLTATKHWEQADLERHTSVEEFAGENLAELRSLQPAGPYLLGGYSMGVPIALEMAYRLHLAGETVELLFLLDPPLRATDADGNAVSTSMRKATREEHMQGMQRPAGGGNFSRHRQRMAALPLTGRISYAAVRVFNKTRDILWKRPRGYMRNQLVRPLATALAAAYRKRGLQVPAPLRNHYVTSVYTDACNRYQFKPYAGSVVIFHASKSMQQRRLWEAVTSGDLHVECFHGGHMDFIADQELMRNWTSRLAELLQEHESAAAASSDKRQAPE